MYALLGLFKLPIWLGLDVGSIHIAVYPRLYIDVRFLFYFILEVI